MSLKQKSRKVRFDSWGYAFVTPFVLAFLLFQLYPIVNTFYLAFTDMKGSSPTHSMVGFKNFFKTDQALDLVVTNAQDANDLVEALMAASIAAGTDAPAVSSADDPFSLDTTEAPEPTTITGTFYVRANQLTESEVTQVRSTLASQGYDQATIDQAMVTVKGGLIFDGNFWKAFGNTWILWLFNFVPQLGIALLFAVWFTDIQLRLKMTGLFKTLFYMPNIITAASVAVLFSSLFGYPAGPLNQFIVSTFKMDEAINFFRDQIFTRGIVSFIQFWMWFGSTIIVLIAGIVAIPNSLFESAIVDGASKNQIFTKITLPLLRPIMSYTLVTSLIGGMQMFDIPFLLTDRRGAPGGSINTTAMYLYNHAFSSGNNYSYAATVSIGMFAMILALSMVVFFGMRDKNELGTRKRG